MGWAGLTGGWHIFFSISMHFSQENARARLAVQNVQVTFKNSVNVDSGRRRKSAEHLRWHVSVVYTRETSDEICAPGYYYIWRASRFITLSASVPTLS